MAAELDVLDRIWVQLCRFNYWRNVGLTVADAGAKCGMDYADAIRTEHTIDRLVRDLKNGAAPASPGAAPTTDERTHRHA